MNNCSLFCYYFSCHCIIKIGIVDIENSKITYLDRNEHQYGPAPACFEALHKIDSVMLSEYSRDHAFGYKSPITKRLSDDLGIDEKDIMLGFGGEDILKQAV
ncbi:MAG: hypothetical protein WBO31_11215, partial [Saprospiraceae bacterium]